MPPLLALVGMALVNASRGVELADVVGGLAVAMALAAVVLPTASWTPPRILLLASALLTATWQGTFRGGWLAGYDVQHEFYIGTLAINQAQFPLQHSSRGRPFATACSRGLRPPCAPSSSSGPRRSSSSSQR